MDPITIAGIVIPVIFLIISLVILFIRRCNGESHSNDIYSASIHGARFYEKDHSNSYGYGQPDATPTPNPYGPHFVGSNSDQPFTSSITPVKTHTPELL